MQNCIYTQKDLVVFLKFPLSPFFWGGGVKGVRSDVDNVVYIGDPIGKGSKGFTLAK